MDAQKNIRAFLAIEPSEEVLAAIARLQEKIKREVSGRISWTQPHGNHLTLKFFGNIDSNDVESICGAARMQAADAPPILLKIEKTGVFPDLRRPRIIWVGTAGESNKLALLQNKLETSFAELGFPREDRPFRAHLTLGRIRDAQAGTGISKVIEKHSDFSAGEFQATELILFQSNLTPHGATYTKLETISLAIKNKQEQKT